MFIILLNWHMLLTCIGPIIGNYVFGVAKWFSMPRWGWVRCFVHGWHHSGYSTANRMGISLTWARMHFKPNKSRCLVLKGIISQQFKMKVQGDDIPTIQCSQQSYKIPWEVVWLITHRQQSDKGAQTYSNIMAKDSWQERPTREVQSLDLPSWNPTKIDVVAADIWSGNGRGRGIGEEELMVKEFH